MAWDLSCPDWEDRLRTGRSLVPALPLNAALGNTAVSAFDKLKLADVTGTPRLGPRLLTDPDDQAGDACGDWFRDIVRALAGSWDPVQQQRMIREIFLLVPKKNSKALALDTPIATPDGFTTMGSVQVGDLVMAIDGTPTRVIAKSQVFTGRKCYAVEFSTGETVVCDAEHLWVTDAHTDRAKHKTRKSDDRKTPRPSVKTTAEIAATLTVASGQLLIRNHRTALCAPLQLPDAVLPIHPYVLGVWLGDGHSGSATVTSSRDDADHMVEQLRRAGHAARVVRLDPRSAAVSISIAELGPKRARLPYRFRTEAARLGLLGNKHIPAGYLRASMQQRLQLLQGLMDTDGSITRRGQASFTTTSERLRDGMVELVNSLGLKASWSEHRATLGDKDCGPCWKLQFWPFDDTPVFTLPRKLARQRPAALRGTSTRSITRQIVAVREVDSVPTQCIAVEHESRQYLVTRSLVPTHNTSYSALLMLVMLLLNQRPHAPFMLSAPVQDTADLAFSQIEGAVALDPVLEKTLHVQSHRKTIVHRVTKAELEIITFDPKVVTGKKFVGALLDEIHVIAKNAKAASSLRQIRGGMLPFPEAFLVMNTTQSEEPPVGIMKAELETARAVRDGTLQGGYMLPVLYEFPRAMQLDQDKPWRDSKHWHMVTPNAGKSIQIKRLEEECADAERKGIAELLGWASQHLNIQIGLAQSADSWVGASFWEPCGDKKVTLEHILAVSEVVTIGIDGGGLDDLLGFAVIGREPSGRWLHWGKAWAHPIVLQRRKEIAPLLLDLVAAGDLTLVERVGEDIEELVDLVLLIEASGLLDRIGVDAIGIASIVDTLIKAKFEQDRIIAIQQGYKLNGVIKALERRLVAKTFLHGAQPLMAWSVGNAKTVVLGNAIGITKAASGLAKIDPVMAALDAAALMATNPKPRKKKHQLFFA